MSLWYFVKQSLVLLWYVVLFTQLYYVVSTEKKPFAEYEVGVVMDSLNGKKKQH